MKDVAASAAAVVSATSGTECDGGGCGGKENNQCSNHMIPFKIDEAMVILADLQDLMDYDFQQLVVVMEAVAVDVVVVDAAEIKYARHSQITALIVVYCLCNMRKKKKTKVPTTTRPQLTTNCDLEKGKPSKTNNSRINDTDMVISVAAASVVIGASGGGGCGGGGCGGGCGG
ncbi:hypothetical protein Tco_0371831 [Tanacetum coccineum]